MYEMMKRKLCTRLIYQPPHVKDLMDDLDTLYKSINLTTKDAPTSIMIVDVKHVLKKPPSPLICIAVVGCSFLIPLIPKNIQLQNMINRPHPQLTKKLNLITPNLINKIGHHSN